MQEVYKAKKNRKSKIRIEKEMHETSRNINDIKV